MLEYNKILIRIGEIALKKNNRKIFTKILVENINHLLSTRVSSEYDRLFIEYTKENIEGLNYIFGVVSYSPVVRVETSEEAIENFISENLDLFKNKKFRITVNRHWKQFPINSMDYAKNIGAYVFSKTDCEVSLKNYDINFSIEIRKNGTYLFWENIKGLGGLPAGSNGRVLHLLSGGIDSPVAAIEMIKRGIHVDVLNFVTPPSTDEKTEIKVNKITKIISRYQKNTTLYRSNYSEIQNILTLVSDESYRITLMRRSFYRIATMLAFEKKYKDLSNGENLGQVASQTMPSIRTIQNVTNLVIYRPLLTYDKLEIIEKAKKYDTYDLSIERANETCELFAPDKPVIKPNVKRAELLEQEIADTLFKLEEENIKNNIDIIKI